MVASSLDTLRPVLLEGWAGKHDLAECLKASATVPQLAGAPALARTWMRSPHPRALRARVQTLRNGERSGGTGRRRRSIARCFAVLRRAGTYRHCRGHRLVDAAIFEPVPLRTALRDGCTHVLVLCTRPATLHTSWRKAVRGTVVRVVKSTVLNAPYMRAAFSTGGSGDELMAQVGNPRRFLPVRTNAGRAPLLSLRDVSHAWGIRRPADTAVDQRRTGIARPHRR